MGSFTALLCLVLFQAAKAFSVGPSTQRQTIHTSTATCTETMEIVTTLPSVAANAKRIFWVRHGEVINPGGPGRSVYYGAQDVPLSPLGEQEAQAAAEFLKDFELTHIFSSPLKRAFYGAKQVLELQSNAQGVTQLAGFCELDRGAWCGLTKDEIGAANLARFDACDESITPSGGESYPALKERVLNARDEALDTLQPGEMGCVVSHLQVTRSVLSDALSIPTHEMAGLKIATASITCIDFIQDNEQGPVVHFQSFKPEVGLPQSKDGAN